ncbi:hypothetical protein HanPI659440_Chr04g0143561 [Helianthus annuus]|nr:hypothetical protein HanPI659440_Chr04g0143561 [Helianthus annuus]
MRYKFLLHVLIQCLSNRRAGYDMVSNDLVGLMVALVLNKPFSISKFILSNMKENLERTGARTTRNKFWMYPRFLQMIINVQHLNLPKADNDILKIDAMLDHSLKIFKGVAAKRYKESTPPRKMFGVLADKAYVALVNDKWCHDDSQSDDEEPKLKKMMEDKFGRKKIKIFSDSTESDDNDDDDDDDDDDDNDDDDDDDAGTSGDVGASGAGAPDAGAGGDVGASAAGAPGASAAGGDEEDSDSEDNPPEPGYEYFYDNRGVRQVRRIRQEEDADYVPSNTEVERLKKKETVVRRK